MCLSHDAMIDSVFLSNSVQNFKSGIEDSTCVNIMAWLDQFGFKNSPTYLGDIQMKQVWALALSTPDTKNQSRKSYRQQSSKPM